MVQCGRAAIKEATSTNRDWQTFAVDLARCLRDIQEDEFLIVDSKRGGYYVQFACQGQFGIRVEAVGNAHLATESQLSTDDYVRMGQLGWHIPERAAEISTDPDGSLNFYSEFPSPVDFEGLSRLAVSTLRSIYHIGHPGLLQYKSFSSSGTEIRFPALRIKREE